MISADQINAVANSALPILGIVSTALVIVSHTAAIFGSPKAGEEAGKLQQFIKVVIDVLSANYGKAKNAPPK